MAAAAIWLTRSQGFASKFEGGKRWFVEDPEDILEVEEKIAAVN